MHKDPVRFFDCLRNEFPLVEIRCHTNGSGLTSKAWKEFADLDIEIEFGIDGLEDTHHLYRRNTSFKQIIKNAKTYIEAGGKATWMMTVFKHNEHQIESCRRLANDLGFYEFISRVNTRNNEDEYILVFDDDFKYSYPLLPATSRQESLGRAYTEEEANQLGHEKEAGIALRYERLAKRGPTKHDLEVKLSKPQRQGSINCVAKSRNEVFINAQGRVVPCCWLGIHKTAPKVNYYDEMERLLTENDMTFDDLSISNGLVNIITSPFFTQLNSSMEEQPLRVCSDHCTAECGYVYCQQSKERSQF
jgi:MoaA/NifB/PqqE/SkfB family radical SAM enzyme